MKYTPEMVIDTLKKSGKTLATAESCTGGLIAKLITDISGASEIFEGTVVSYSNGVKERVLGVSRETLEKYGAVSEETAIEMSEGVRRITGADIAVSTTGIAGPGGGTAEKPVGTVCFAIATENGTKSFKRRFGDGSRDEIRKDAAEFAMLLVVEGCKYGT